MASESSHEVTHGSPGNATTGASRESLSYSACVMPEFVARIRSGSSFAISSIGAPSASAYRVGCSPPSSASASSNHGVEPCSLPPQVISTAPTGTTPSESTASWSDQPSVATRVGSASIVVEP